MEYFQRFNRKIKLNYIDFLSYSISVNTILLGDSVYTLYYRSMTVTVILKQQNSESKQRNQNNKT